MVITAEFHFVDTSWNVGLKNSMNGMTAGRIRTGLRTVGLRITQLKHTSLSSSWSWV